ncbi:nuclear transport factor 2 family protein [Gordonia sp. zg691]|uniref:nuclear transport factor 2 family protein n=1 Tax=Gordonia jinghuaiqii TaxID=2758710 RepID=UPI001662867F|nr:limonene-1,2-epoxide hydrolase family protein [Gordonia jinghuaiqii]MBD0859809.1 nuclear transport factor 2 family protein [Gordonia jinghuaiqii]
MTVDAALPHAVRGFLDAINARDLEAAAEHLTDDVSYHLLMPHPAVTGRGAVLEALGGAVLAADRVDWEVISCLADDRRAFVERIDRFYFGDREASIECLGVFELRGDKISAVRDYADLETWRRRKEAARQTS